MNLSGIHWRSKERWAADEPVLEACRSVQTVLEVGPSRGCFWTCDRVREPIAVVHGTQISFTSFSRASFCQDRESFMHSRLVFSAMVVASLVGTSALAAAQTQSTLSASANSNAMASMHHHMKTHYQMHHVRYSRATMDKSRPGGLPISRNPPD
jgi:hypothetical protein